MTEVKLDFDKQVAGVHTKEQIKAIFAELS